MRCATTSFIMLVKKRDAPRPARLTSYMAISAFFTRRSNSTPSCGNSAMPMLEDTSICMPEMRSGAASAWRRRSAACIASTGLQRGSTAANSSPPRRATVALSPISA